MTGLGFGSSCAFGIILLIEESVDGGGSPILDSDDEGGYDWGRRPNEARYDLASLRDGFERRIDMKKSCDNCRDEEQTECTIFSYIIRRGCIVGWLWWRWPPTHGLRKIGERIKRVGGRHTA